jgi:hypothetical protein
MKEVPRRHAASIKHPRHVTIPSRHSSCGRWWGARRCRHSLTVPLPIPSMPPTFGLHVDAAPMLMGASGGSVCGVVVSVVAGWLKGTHHPHHLVHRLLQLHQLAFTPYTPTFSHAFYMGSAADVRPRFFTSLRGVAFGYH